MAGRVTHPHADLCLGEGGNLQLWLLGCVPWELCSLWRAWSAWDRGAAATFLLPQFRAGPWPEAWRNPSAVWMWGCSNGLGWELCSWSVYPSLLSLSAVPSRKAGQPCLARHNLCLHCWLHSLNSVLNFILKNLERNWVPSDAKIPIFRGTALQGIQLWLRALLLFLAFGKHFLEPSRCESCPMWAPLREGDFCHTKMKV